jgi:hypothetical protein
MTETIRPESKIYNYSNTITNENRSLLLNIDYTKPLKNGTLELGIEAINQKYFNHIVTRSRSRDGQHTKHLSKGEFGI